MHLTPTSQHTRAHFRNKAPCPLLFPACIALLSIFLSAGFAFGQDENLLESGIQAFEEKNYSQAISQLSSFVSDASSPKAYLYLGHAHYFQKSYDQAKKMYRKARENGLSEPRTSVYLARVTIAENRPFEAIRTLRPLIDREDVGSAARTFMGRALDRAGLHEIASDVYRWKYMREEQEQESILQQLYQLAMKQNRYSLAREYVSGLMKHRSTLEATDLLLDAKAALKQNNIREAEISLDLARRFGRIDPELYRSLADIQSRQENFRKAAHYYRILFQQIESPRARDQYRLGVSLLKLQQFESAETWLFRAAEQKPSYLTGVRRLVRSLHEHRPFEEVKEVLSRARTSFPDDLQLRVLEGNLYLAEELPDQAYNAFEPIVPGNVDNRETLYNYAYAAYQSNHRDRSLAVLTEAIARFPEHRPFRRLLNKLLETS